MWLAFDQPQPPNMGQGPRTRNEVKNSPIDFLRPDLFAVSVPVGEIFVSKPRGRMGI